MSMRKLLCTLGLVCASVAHAGPGFLVGWYLTGTEIVCEYETDNGVYAIIMQGQTECPQVIFIDEGEW